MRPDLKALGDAVIASVKGHVAAAVSSLAERIADLDVRLKAIPAGPAGERGEKGDAGLPGEVGPRGEAGEPGPRGETGPSGIDGKDGAPGVAGRDGNDGVRGKDGEPGPRGADGEPGEAGRSGIDGKDGAPGLRGADGKDGHDGRDGREGKDGLPGRDAMELDILSAIDATRSYPRGTFAQYGGGIARAVRNTDPLGDGEPTAAGWAFIVRGISSVGIVQTDERNFEFVVTLSDGAIGRQSFSVPVMIYRGIYRDGPHLRGDTATWDGSLWHCEEPTADKPGVSQAWKLCAKRGRDGRVVRAEKI